MNKILLTLLAPFIFSSVFSTRAHAFILIEPSIGYQMGTSKTKSLSGTETEFTGYSPAAGLRLGYVFPFRAFISVDGQYGFNGKVKPKETALAGAVEEYNAEETSGYITLGYETMYRVRIWGSAGVSDTLKLKDPKKVLANDVTYSGGVPFKVGLGYHVTQSICLNLEYSMHDYKKVKSTAYDNVNLRQAGLESVKAESLLLSLSAPIFW